LRTEDIIVMRRALLAPLVIVAWLALGGTAGVASAHAEFYRATVPISSTTSITLNVPHERAADVYNITVRIQIPGNWQATGCQSPSGWTCGAGGVIEFSKLDPATELGTAEDFTFTLTAPASLGEARFPVVQIYSTGENVLWQGTANLTVVGVPNPGPESESAPSATASGSSQNIAGGGSASGPAIADAPSPSPSSTEFGDAPSSLAEVSDREMVEGEAASAESGSARRGVSSS
jgi:hypothetical protein